MSIKNHVFYKNFHEQKTFFEYYPSSNTNYSYTFFVEILLIRAFAQGYSVVTKNVQMSQCVVSEGDIPCGSE